MLLLPVSPRITDVNQQRFQIAQKHRFRNLKVRKFIPFPFVSVQIFVLSDAPPRIQIRLADVINFVALIKNVDADAALSFSEYHSGIFSRLKF
jgi:hypothetical protein